MKNSGRGREQADPPAEPSPPLVWGGGWLVKSVDTIAPCVHEEGGEAVRVSVEVVVLVVYISTTATAIYFSGMWKRIRCKGS
jgi:hypothetical protein